MELQSTSEVKATIASAYINENILNILKRMYVRKIKNKVLRLFIFCNLYEQRENIQDVV